MRWNARWARRNASTTAAGCAPERTTQPHREDLRSSRTLGARGWLFASRLHEPVALTRLTYSDALTGPRCTPPRRDGRSPDDTAAVRRDRRRPDPRTGRSARGDDAG